MIRFFRKIRQNHLLNRRFSKYILYAIGEIFLVVIGILLALQINNWNSDRIEKKSETQILVELKQGLVLDLEIIRQEQLEIEMAIHKIMRLQELMEDPKKPYESGLDTLFGAVYGMRHLRLNTAFYEDLKSSGLSLIRDEQIRLQIVQLFENNYAEILGLSTNEQSVNEVNRPYYLSNFYDLDFWESATPNDHQQVWTDSYYHNIVDYRLITLESNQVNYYARIIPAMENLIKNINNYLISLET